MAQFEESKIINALHPEKAEVGKKYWVSNQLMDLRKYVTNDGTPLILTDIREDNTYCPFTCSNKGCYQFLYPYEEPPKKYRPYVDTEEMINDFCERSGTKVNPKKIKDMCENCLETCFDQWRHKVAELEKENAELKVKNEDLRTFAETISENHSNEWQKQQQIITELKAQIEKMKCCENCKHWCKEGYECLMGGSYTCNNNEEWELAE